MTSLLSNRVRFISILIVAILVGCSRGTISSLPAAGFQRDSANHVVAAGKKSDGSALIYLSYGEGAFGAAPSVGVYTFPQGKLVGRWSGTAGSFTGGECSDSTGNTYVTYSLYVPGTGGWAGEILKFSSGETSPVAILKDPSAFPVACSIDPVSGNLAVANSGAATLAIYKSASGTPTVYTDSNVNLYGVTYDNNGSVFVDGLTAFPDLSFSLAELRNGSTSLEHITLNRQFRSAGELQWDGTYVTLGEGWIYRLAIHGTTGRVIGSTRLANFAHDGFSEYWVSGNQVVVAWYRRPVACPPEGCGAPVGRAGLWSYPSGLLVRKGITGQVSGPSGVTLSAETSR